MTEYFYRLFTSLLLILILFLSYKYNQIFIAILFVVFFFTSIEFTQLISKIKKLIKYRILIIFSWICYLFFVFVHISNLEEIKILLFYFIIICISSDIGGFVFGKIFKGKKLTKISPKKTYAGFYGAFLISLLSMFMFFEYLNMSNFIVFILTISACLLSQLGDLFFSYIKRLAKVKDSGNILPGHGGLLDRVDGIIISVPINIFFYNLSI